MLRSVLIAVFFVSLVSCAALKTADGGSALVDPDLVRTVTFDHQCSREQIVLLRGENYTYDLSVCGKTRRYKRFGAGGKMNRGDWVDVTNLYPAGALPMVQ